MATFAENSITLQPQMEELLRLMEWIEAFAEANDCGPADTMALTLAAEELFTNTMRHGESDREHPPRMSLRREGDLITMVYADSGVAFDTAAGAEAGPVNAGAEVHEMAVGGLGLHFLAKTMASVRYERVNGRNVTTLERPLGWGKLTR